MPALRVHNDGDACWPDIGELRDAGKLQHTTLSEIAFLQGGMASGDPSVTLRMTLADGTVVIAETSVALLRTALGSFDQYTLGKIERGER